MWEPGAADVFYVQTLQIARAREDHLRSSEKSSLGERVMEGHQGLCESEGVPMHVTTLERRHQDMGENGREAIRNPEQPRLRERYEKLIENALDSAF